MSPEQKEFNDNMKELFDEIDNDSNEIMKLTEETDLLIKECDEVIVEEL